MKDTFLPMKLQIFAEPPEPTGTGSPTEPQQDPAANQGGAQIDYSKIQQMLEGTLKAKEDTALKAYFKQQGLSQEEAEQAIMAFKQQKAAQTPDVGAMQAQLTQAQEAAQKAMVESAATVAAVSLGIDAKTIPYLIKIADFSAVVGEDGKVNDETMKAALNKVLEDIPALKPQEAGKTGFTQIGTGGNPAQHPQQAAAAPQAQTATKRWNRFN